MLLIVMEVILVIICFCFNEVDNIWDAFGLVRVKVSQLCKVVAKALLSTNKINSIAKFHAMAVIRIGYTNLLCLQQVALGPDVNVKQRKIPCGKQSMLNYINQLPLNLQEWINLSLLL
jgi:hypothetical protein